MTREPAEAVASLRETIEMYADRMESERRMPIQLHRALKSAGLFGLYVPERFGGAGKTLPEALETVEAVSAIDGSTGWTVALTFAAGLFSSFVPDHVSAEILGDGSALVVGGGRPVRAVEVEGGYRLYGQAPFVSGAEHADWVSLMAIIHDGETPRMGPGGPAMISFFIPRSEVDVIDTWHVTGLAGTGTNDVRFSGQFVPLERTVIGSPATGFHAYRDEPLARIPFMSLIAAVQAPPVCLGIARHAMDAFIEIARSKVNPMSGERLHERASIQANTARAEALIRTARLFFFSTIRDVWEKAERGVALDVSDRAAIRLACTTVAESCVEAVDLLFKMAGTTAIQARTPLERCWRDIHAAASHHQVQDSHWESAGRVLLGLEPGTMMF